MATGVSDPGAVRNGQFRRVLSSTAPPTGGYGPRLTVSIDPLPISDQTSLAGPSIADRRQPTTSPANGQPAVVGGGSTRALPAAALLDPVASMADTMDHGCFRGS